MNACPREPNPGDRITATFMRELVRYVRSLYPLEGPGMKFRRTPNGTVFTPEPTAKAVRTSQLEHPFDIESVTPSGSGSLAVTFKNRWYTIGSHVYECEMSSFSVSSEGFVALVASITVGGTSAYYRSFASLSALNQAANESASAMTLYFRPLYYFAADANGNLGLKVDLRNLPELTAREVF